ncbi:MAG: site-specific DNA-methyltransferase [Spirochaetes bacterium]|jgi:adenine-specific DNA-methyltransferase|nr:site-specific DNA-methyltransferase [Spirochaetota bacterium]
MADQLDRFKDVLKQIFEMDKADLDFGIYRILNQKRDDINNFMDKELLPQVREELSKHENKEVEKLKQELTEAIKHAEDLGENPDKIKRVVELKQRLKESSDVASIEGEIFSHLTSFFGRYYDKGDFISKRRYKEGVYAIPYEGEEVKLYWANHDQYYIKTNEYFKNYIFKIGDKKVHFKIVEGEQNRDNTKSDDDKNRRFILNNDKKYEIIGKELTIFFKYIKDDRNQVRKTSTKPADFGKYINVSIAKELLDVKEIQDSFSELKGIYSESSIPNLTILEKNLNDYTARNTFDYFIHKDLGGFLRRELDFYIKNEVMHIDDLDTGKEMEVQQYMSKIKVIKRIGNKIISFLEQLESFQKKLWLKKKYIIQCDYCITLDRIPEEFYPEIINNRGQIEEWKRLYAIDELTERPDPEKIKKKLEEESIDEEDETDAEDILDEESKDAEHNNAEGSDREENNERPFIPYTEQLTVEFLKANPYLVLDTKFFSDKLKWRIVSSIDDIDEKCDGLLINSENFQALGLLKEKYKKKIKCIYIDPPYNSPSSEIIYKNNYKHSSWITLIENRLLLSKSFMSFDCSYIIAIDDNEINGLFSLVSDSFIGNDNISITIEHNKKGVQGDHFSSSSEYAVFSIPYTLKELNRIDMNFEDWEWTNLRNWGGESLRSDAKNCFYPIFIKDEKIISFGNVCDENYHPLSSNILIKNGQTAIYPIDQKGVERKWRYAQDTIEDIKNKLRIKKEKSGKYTIEIAKTDKHFKTAWYNKKYNAGDYGTKILTKMGFNNGSFDFPKSIYTVKDCIFAVSNRYDHILDYFAGSGTTAHAVINLNRDDKGKRKYILVEMGEYFNSVLKPRIQKVIYSKDWKNGKPVSRKGSSHMFKYMRLESYEDCLNNLQVKHEDIQGTLDALPKQAKEDYTLHYMLDVETRESDSLLNIDKLKNPFNYTLKITRDNEMMEEKVDLVETFNYLIGLYLKKRHAPVDIPLAFERNEDKRLIAKEDKSSKESFTFIALEGENRDGESILVIWRILGDDDEKNNTALLHYYHKYWSGKSFDHVYVNGEHTLPGAYLIEEHFKRLMFDVRDV